MENNTDFQFALLSLCFKNLSSSKKKLLINSLKEDEKNTLKSEPVFLGARDERNLVDNKISVKQEILLDQNNAQEISYEKIDNENKIQEISYQKIEENLENNVKKENELLQDHEKNIEHRSKKVWTKKSRMKVVLEAIKEGNNSKVARQYNISESKIRVYNIFFSNPLLKMLKM